MSFGSRWWRENTNIGACIHVTEACVTAKDTIELDN